MTPETPKGIAVHVVGGLECHDESASISSEALEEVEKRMSETPEQRLEREHCERVAEVLRQECGMKHDWFAETVTTLLIRERAALRAERDALKAVVRELDGMAEGDEFYPDRDFIDRVRAALKREASDGQP